MSCTSDSEFDARPAGTESTALAAEDTTGGDDPFAGSVAEVTAIAEQAGCSDLHVDDAPDTVDDFAAMAHGRCNAPDLTVESATLLIADRYRMVGMPQVNADIGAWAIQGIADPAIGTGPVDTVELVWVPDDGGVLSVSVQGALLDYDTEDGWSAVDVPVTTEGAS